jgi:hypothetical protein
MADNASQSLFVDFMYAVVVGAALPRFKAEIMSLRKAEFWGVLFLLAVFLEDFYLYHRIVLPFLTGFPTAKQITLTMAIVLAWYFAQVSFPVNPRWFLGCLLVFFLLKLMGGVLLGVVHYPWGRDLLFLFPIIICSILLKLRWTAQKSLRVLMPTWIVTVTVWWWGR